MPATDVCVLVRQHRDVLDRLSDLTEQARKMDQAFETFGQLVERDLDGIVIGRGAYRGYHTDRRYRNVTTKKTRLRYEDVDGAAFLRCMEERQELLKKKADLDAQLTDAGFGHLLESA